MALHTDHGNYDHCQLNEINNNKLFISPLPGSQSKTLSAQIRLKLSFDTMLSTVLQLQPILSLSTTWSKHLAIIHSQKGANNWVVKSLKILYNGVLSTLTSSYHWSEIQIKFLRNSQAVKSSGKIIHGSPATATLELRQIYLHLTKKEQLILSTRREQLLKGSPFRHITFSTIDRGRYIHCQDDAHQ